MIEINVARDFSMTPGGRYTKDGAFSGEEFREKFLKPKFEMAIKNSEQLTINLDGGYGYGSSFLEESFGGLARQLGDRRLLNIMIISEEEPDLVERINEYIRNGLEGR